MSTRNDLRRAHARAIRRNAAEIAANRSHPTQVDNGDEFNQRDFIAAYSKGLPHDSTGEVNPTAYHSLLRAVQSGDPEDWERVVLAPTGPPPPPQPYPPPLPRRLKNPQAGLAYDLQGPDVAAVAIPPAPTFNSAETAAEMAESYWMALLRDVNFTEYGTFTGTNTPTDAAASLTNSFTRFTGSRDPITGSVTPATLFRGTLPGDDKGPYISQFLLRGVDAPLAGVVPASGFITFGNLQIDQRQHTAGTGDFLTNFGTWLGSQNRAVPAAPLTRDSVLRFVRNGRDLALRVRPDRAYQHYLNACLILQNVDPYREQIPDRSPGFGTDLGNPYGPEAVNSSAMRSVTQEGFATFGDWHILTLLAEVSTRALQAAWYQKWFIHRRLRPEEFGGRVEQRLKGGPQYDIHPELLSTTVTYNPSATDDLLDRVAASSGSFLLPQAYPEGAPLHPSYPSGHAVLAGACVTILKAYFDGGLRFGPSAATTNRWIGPVLRPNRDNEPNTGDTAGTSLIATNDELTVGGELNKLASNIALGRNFGGVHYRSDYIEGVKLGEEVAIGLLQEQSLRYNENRRRAESPSYTFTRFDGRRIRIERGDVI